MTQPRANNKQHKQPNALKKWLKRIGVGGIIFFTVKGTITTLLFYFLGKNFWKVIKDSVIAWFE